MHATAVPAKLREQLGPEAAEGLVEVLQTAQQEWKDEVIEVCADRFERRLGDEVSKLRLEMAQGDAALRQQMTELGASLRAEMASLGAGLRGEMAEVRAGLRAELASLGAGLRGEMAEVRAGLRAELASLGTSLRGEMAEVRAGLREEMSDGRFDLLKWSFLFWVGQLLGVAGILGLMLRVFRP